ncbi:MAG TPA: 4a-hydroxytetrahydrobiopterin dehydratase [Bacillales bacterium]|nr:4a-hydroxytetrahydrobiopterin dehydratase [Bacillales bacterium]
MVLNKEEIVEKVEQLPGWEHREGQLEKTFTLDDFKASLAFVNKVGELAEGANHHPDILIQYNKVTLSLVSHDAGGITDKDFGLAGEVEKL